MKRKAQTEPLDANVLSKLCEHCAHPLVALEASMDIDREVITRALRRLKRKGLVRYTPPGWVRIQVATMEDVLPRR